MKRTFLAIPVTLTEAFCDYLGEIKETLKRDRIVWVRPEQMHITFFFYGSASGELEKKIHDAAMRVSAATHPGTLEFNKLGVFPSVRRARTLWMAPEDDRYLKDLYLKLRKELQSVKAFTPGEKEFIPHLTLGRIKRTEDISQFSRLLKRFERRTILKTPAEKMVYYQSTLTTDGPVYTPLGIYAFDFQLSR